MEFYFIDVDGARQKESGELLKFYMKSPDRLKDITKAKSVTYRGKDYRFKKYNLDKTIAYFHEIDKDDIMVENTIKELAEAGIIQKEKHRKTVPYYDQGTVDFIEDKLPGLHGYVLQGNRLKTKEIIEESVSVKKPSYEYLKDGYVLTTTGSIKYVPSTNYTEKKLKRIFRNGRWFRTFKEAKAKQKEESLLGKIRIIRTMLNGDWEEDYTEGYVIVYEVEKREYYVVRAFRVKDFNKLGLYKDKVTARVVLELFKDEIERILI